MLSKAQKKLIKSLQYKKYRQKERSFLVEGKKSVLELLNSSFEVQYLVATSEFIDELAIPKSIQIIEEKAEIIGSVGTFKSNDQVLAVVTIPETENILVKEQMLTICLDNIQDPGNLGTIIRIADWYGVSQIVASESTVDFFNPKVISATMGSFTRVDCLYTPLEEYLKSARAEGKKIIGAALGGENLHKAHFSGSCVVLMGNESNGISNSLRPLLDQELAIPGWGGAESLNVAMSTAIFCDNIMRNLT